MSQVSHSWGYIQGDQTSGFHTRLPIIVPHSFLFQHSSYRISSSINIVLLGKWKGLGWLSCAVHAICLDLVAFWVNLHLRPGIVELHILFANGPAMFHWLDSFLQVV
jgi:hypothetical protein